jgi:hypothetical protein
MRFSPARRRRSNRRTVRHKKQLSCEGAGHAGRHREAHLVAHAHPALASIVKKMVVGKRRKSSRKHAVAKVARRIEPIDQALVMLREAELPTAPQDTIAAGHKPFGAPAHRTHLQLQLHNRQAR